MPSNGNLSRKGGGMICPFCKSEIDDKASVCSHCTKDLSAYKHPAATLVGVGVGLSGCGVWLLWIPIIGIPFIIIGLGMALFGLVSGIARSFMKLSKKGNEKVQQSKEKQTEK